MPKITTTLVADKETPGTIRFMEPDVTDGLEKPLSIYLRKEMVEHLVGSEVEIGVTAVKLTLDRA